MVEEKSMMKVLELLLPRVVPETIDCTIISHQGKNDLEKSIPRKLKAWTNPDARFIILRDNDGGDCRKLKERLVGVCRGAGKEAVCLVRIVCQELESWFLGDLRAVDASRLSGRLEGRQRRNPYRDPDRITDAKGKLRELAPSYYPLSGASAIAPHMDIAANKSLSFGAFIEGVRAVVAALEGC